MQAFKLRVLQFMSGSLLAPMTLPSTSASVELVLGDSTLCGGPLFWRSATGDDKTAMAEPSLKQAGDVLCKGALAEFEAGRQAAARSGIRESEGKARQ
jgi:hypothetical protein